MSRPPVIRHSRNLHHPLSSHSFFFLANNGDLPATIRARYEFRHLSFLAAGGLSRHNALVLFFARLLAVVRKAGVGVRVGRGVRQVWL